VTVSTGAVLGPVSRGGADEVDRAASAARTALADWRRTAPADRSAVLSRVADASDTYYGHIVAWNYPMQLVSRAIVPAVAAGNTVVHASRDKFPRAVLPRTFDYGFATGLMAKDVRLYLDEAHTLGVPSRLAETVAALWDATLNELGGDADFTSIVKPMEREAGVTVGDET
jgi:3-hydroxyisobutyrate dehydrogenase